jgi:hypothetical protein
MRIGGLSVSDRKDDVVPAARTHILIERSDQIESVLGQEGEDGEIALLEMSLRVD